jgi:hypothetical protein
MAKERDAWGEDLNEQLPFPMTPNPYGSDVDTTVDDMGGRITPTPQQRHDNVVDRDVVGGTAGE